MLGLSQSQSVVNLTDLLPLKQGLRQVMKVRFMFYCSSLRDLLPLKQGFDFYY